MDDCFILISYDGQNYTGPVAKRKFNTYKEAEDHAKVVMTSGGNLNLQGVYIMQAIAIAERRQPPVEIVPILRHAVAQAAE